MISFKETVVFATNPENLAMLHAISRAYGDRGLVARISAGRDGTHMPKSKHYQDLAFDVSVRNVPETQLPGIVRDLQAYLGPDYDIVYEADVFVAGKQVRWKHIHIEFDPVFSTQSPPSSVQGSAH